MSKDISFRSIFSNQDIDIDTSACMEDWEKSSKPLRISLENTLLAQLESATVDTITEIDIKDFLKD